MTTTEFGYLILIELCTITKNRFCNMGSPESPSKDSDKHYDPQQANV